MNRVGLIAVVSGVVFILIMIISIVSWYSNGVSLQESTMAQYRNNMNSYDAFWKKVVEVAQVPDKYKSDFKELLTAEVSAKFGPNGSGAMMQWFQERDLRPSADMYLKVQQVIESGRNDFAKGQELLLDKQRAVRTHRKGVWGKFCLFFADYLDDMAGELAPPKDLDGDFHLTVLDYDIVTSTRTKEAFAAGEDEPLQVFPTSQQVPVGFPKASKVAP